MDKDMDGGKWILISFIILIITSMVFLSYSFVLEDKIEKLESDAEAKNKNTIQSKEINFLDIGDTYTDTKTYYYTDSVSNYCFEYVPEDSIIVLRCVCLCGDYKKKLKSE